MYSVGMAKKKKKPSTNVRVRALHILEAITNSQRLIDLTPHNSSKKPAAVTLDRLGARKVGTARAKKLSAKQRTEIAKEAARTR
jgi:ABC-type phosphate/phosphonate transport system ATPase subunit